ncbi:hypothetical protein VTN77DRAFT_9303 [Rasamsonia byssochlamydoides]|uniref:uncharacterized protein n=1 Tax=Rasamsonia byssochlamydoides TaxID=89139 RepID=UPI003741EDED
MEPAPVVIRTLICRSHAKSTLGCKPCKQQHVKCDELRPRCRQCAQRNRICEYAGTSRSSSSPTTAEVSQQEQLFWPATMENDCRSWKQTGIPPLPHLRALSSPRWHNFSLHDLRYLHPLGLRAAISIATQRYEWYLWNDQFPLFLRLSVSYDFVSHAVITCSAFVLALATQSLEADQVASRYRYLAIRGLQQDLRSFSKTNADAVLVTSILLSMHCHEWRSWKVLIERTSSIATAMQPFRRDSELSAYISHGPDADMMTVESDSSSEVDSLLSEGLDSLKTISVCARSKPELAATIRRLCDCIQIVRKERNAMTAEEQFQLLYPLDACVIATLFPLPEDDPLVMLTLSYVYSTIILFAMAFDRKINQSFYARVWVRAILGIRRQLLSQP